MALFPLKYQRDKRALSSVVDNFNEPPSAIKALALKVRSGFMAQTKSLEGGELATVTDHDLALLYLLYDRHFFSSRLEPAIGDRLTFRVSDRMTRAGGKLRHYPVRAGLKGGSYELVVSRRLLLENFKDKSPVEVNAVACKDRLEALQSIFEHELLHLVEIHLTGSSRCKSARFRENAARLFGHKGVTHCLTTKRASRSEVKGAVSDSPASVGDMVAFDFKGEKLTGRVNRITKRATVLVEGATGRSYDDGKRYHKYYVPLSRLEVLEQKGDSIAQPWWLYLLECRAGVVYAGVAVDVQKRFNAHKSGKGARFTRANPPLRILGAKRFEGRSQAQKAEVKLKGLKKLQKLEWAAQNPWRANAGK